VDTAREWRGGQNQTLLTALGMATRGHTVTLACQRGGVLEQRGRAAGLDVRALEFRGDLAPGAVVALVRVLRDARPEIVHLHDPHATASGLLAARLAGRSRTVATRRVDFPLRGPLSRRKYAACDRVIAVSRAIASVLEKDGLPAPHVRLVYEGVPDRPAQVGGRAALTALGVPADALVIGNVAALTDHKDHATLLEAAARAFGRVPRACLVIVGDGELRPQLEAQARSLGLGERCVFAGFRSDLDLLIPAFDIFCLSSHAEGLGTSLLDAMCFSRPIVATAAGGIPEAVVDGGTGCLVPTRDADALGTALAALLADAPRREALGRAGRQRFQERFTADRMVEETLHVDEEVCAFARS
jgi:glycosyltransferase involved in cell wall biosynthesis